MPDPTPEEVAAFIKQARDWASLKEKGPDTANPMIKRAMLGNSKIMVNMDALPPEWKNESAPPERNPQLAMIRRTETQIGITKHGHPIIQSTTE